MVQILKSGPNSMIFNAKSNLVRENAVRFGLGGATGFTLPFLHMAWGTCSQTEAHKYQLYCNKVGVYVLERRRIVPVSRSKPHLLQKIGPCWFFWTSRSKMCMKKNVFR